MKLEKLAKELKVPHQKLTETVDHSQTTLLHYNTFLGASELGKYNWLTIATLVLVGVVTNGETVRWKKLHRSHAFCVTWVLKKKKKSNLIIQRA